MTANAASAAPTTAMPPGEAVVWVFDPWRERPGSAAAAATCALALCALVLALRLPFVLAAALCIACVASFAPAVAPVECRIDEAGVARRGPLGWDRRRWTDVRRSEPLPAGVLLSPFATRHWLDPTRALLLPMPAAKAGELRAAVDRFRGARGE